MSDGLTEITITLTPKDITDIKALYAAATGNAPESLKDHLQGFCNMLLRYGIEEMKTKNGG